MQIPGAVQGGRAGLGNLGHLLRGAARHHQRHPPRQRLHALGAAGPRGGPLASGPSEGLMCLRVAAAGVGRGRLLADLARQHQGRAGPQFQGAAAGGALGRQLPWR